MMLYKILLYKILYRKIRYKTKVGRPRKTNISNIHVVQEDIVQEVVSRKSKVGRPSKNGESLDVDEILAVKKKLKSRQKGWSITNREKKCKY